MGIPKPSSMLGTLTNLLEPMALKNSVLTLSSMKSDTFNIVWTLLPHSLSINIKNNVFDTVHSSYARNKNNLNLV